MNKVILISGASSGIGFATLEKLISEGHTVYGSGRAEKDLEKIKNAGGRPLEMEMTDYPTLEKAVDSVIENEGRIDVLFNNAGYGLYGTVEETSIDRAKHQFDVNLFGLARLTQLVLPHMRRQQSGTIINTSSMGGKVYTPLGAWYHATKHAVEGWSDCLRLELKEFGINVVVVEPGGIQTAWGTIAADNLQEISSRGPYKDFGKKVADGMRSRYERRGALSPPSVIADVVSKAISSSRPRTRYVAGKYARPLLLIRKYLGDRVYDRVAMSAA
ncbi:oxidoreductase [Rhodococcus xishaensis]|uniref:SDR family NAD(P)-dependent oxidoreductase n=1 Tax=Rhodococcus xishaensis TaxID=2487364 RepID=A0A438AN78_9NOCA|nr:oxidoreductase [Rhodococcus xishaensis]RVW00316.1 SDR family NAD(P)-dependent oxidoreductase [Rhodococcus xishaensis]